MAKFAEQRRKMEALQGEKSMAVPRNASPSKWTAPPDDMKNGNANYGPTEPPMWNRHYDFGNGRKK